MPFSATATPVFSLMTSFTERYQDILYTRRSEEPRGTGDHEPSGEGKDSVGKRERRRAANAFRDVGESRRGQAFADENVF